MQNVFRNVPSSETNMYHVPYIL